jgi:predicted secreted Zn-dependent protease
MPIPERLVPNDPRDGDRVYILRFWNERESGSDAAPVWRAKVSDVVSGEEKHVNGVEAALEHVRRSMDRSPD